MDDFDIKNTYRSNLWKIQNKKSPHLATGMSFCCIGSPDLKKSAGHAPAYFAPPQTSFF
jgi:hypothetical protein